MHTIYEADVKQLIHLLHQLHAELGTCTPLYPSGGPWWQCVRESADREEERRSNISIMNTVNCIQLICWISYSNCTHSAQKR